MARSQRLNESNKPIIDGGMADDLHKIILPQNSTTNLAEITPQVGSIAYDSTLNEVVVNNGSGFVSVAAGSAVSSITAGTGLSGGTITSTGTISLSNTAVTPASYTNANITVNQQGQITSASNGSSGANTSLSNLSTTSINTNLLPEFTTTYTVGNANAVWNGVYTNLVQGMNGGGSVEIATSLQTTGSGNISLVTGTASSGNSGNITLTTGTASGTQGYVSITALYLGLPTGAADPTAPAGAIYYNTTSNMIRWYNGTAWANLT
jgi:hypothetical protein